MNSRDQNWLVDTLVTVVIARAALFRLIRWLFASRATFEIRKARLEIFFQLRQLADLLTGIAQTIGEHFTHTLHRQRSAAIGIVRDPVQQLLQLMERKTGIL